MSLRTLGLAAAALVFLGLGIWSVVVPDTYQECVRFTQGEFGRTCAETVEAEYYDPLRERLGQAFVLWLVAGVLLYGTFFSYRNDGTEE